jgi:DNA-binding transcriptional LysR family regulator
MPANLVAGHLAAGRLVSLLDDWAPPPVELFLYYSSRRQTPAPLQAFIDFVRAHARHRKAA